jgi:hypothetical protein
MHAMHASAVLGELLMETWTMHEKEKKRKDASFLCQAPKAPTESNARVQLSLVTSRGHGWTWLEALSSLKHCGVASHSQQAAS